MNYQLTIIFLATLLASGCVSDQVDTNTNNEDRKISNYVESYNTTIDNYNISIQERLGDRETFYYMSGDMNWQDKKDIVLESGMLHKVINRCNIAVDYTNKDLSNPCAQLKKELKNR